MLGRKTKVTSCICPGGLLQISNGLLKRGTLVKGCTAEARAHVMSDHFLCSAQTETQDISSPNTNSSLPLVATETCFSLANRCALLLYSSKRAGCEVVHTYTLALPSCTGYIFLFLPPQQQRALEPGASPSNKLLCNQHCQLLQICHWPRDTSHCLAKLQFLMSDNKMGNSTFT